jgi:hypothetical protein
VSKTEDQKERNRVRERTRYRDLPEAEKVRVRARNNAAAKARLAANPEKERARKRKQQKQWRDKNAEHLRSWYRAWRRANWSNIRARERLRAGLPLPARPSSEVCECCGLPPGARALNLDHCHETGAFRGWLCGRCNTALGQLGDNEQGLLRALAYLRRAEAER